MDYQDKIFSFYKAHKRMPVYTEMLKLFGFKSKNAVAKVINRLISEGVIDRDSRGHLIPRRTDFDLPLLGLVEAGFPTIAEEVNLDTINLDSYLIKDKDHSYLLQVKGDSMIEAGIHDGDLVLVEKRNIAKDGEIVIALVDGGWTMKYYRKKANKIYLEPANKNLTNIYPEYQLEIAAVVRAVLRKY